MLHSIDSEILFLKQEDVIKAGLLDMKQILKVTEKTYELMGQGLIKNPPKVRTRIPDDDNWQSFFNSMPCYIGGDVNIGGRTLTRRASPTALTSPSSVTPRPCCRSAFWTVRWSPLCGLLLLAVCWQSTPLPPTPRLPALWAPASSAGRWSWPLRRLSPR